MGAYKVIIPNRVIEYSLKTGKYFFIISVIILALDHWNYKFFPEGMIIFLWLYLIINSFAVSRIIYRRYASKSTSKKCPYCNGSLQGKIIYNCPNCGDLEPKK